MLTTTILEENHAPANCMPFNGLVPVCRTVSSLFQPTPVEVLRDRTAGLIECDGRRTLRGLLTGVGEKVSLCGLSRFFNRWHWSPAEVAHLWLSRFREQMQPQVQAEHQRNLLAWLVNQFNAGLSADQIGAQLALFSS